MNKYIIPAAAAAAAAGLVYVAQRISKVEPDSLADAFRLAALDTLPDRDTIVPPPDSLWDDILGGRRPDYLGGAAWGYYSTFASQSADGSKRKGGTTCGVVAAYWASKAGWPADMINRSPNDVAAPGGGFTPGAHISKVYSGAQRRGWLHVMSSGSSVAGADDVIRAGDYYCIVHDGAMYDGKKSSGEHVGCVLDVSDPNAAGDRTIITADGGHNCNGHQCAHWNTRTLRADGMMVLNGDVASLAWIVRAA